VHLHRQELVAVVDTEGQADELRQDRRTPRPDANDLVAARGPRSIGLVQQVAVDERTLPDRTRHSTCPSSLAGLATANDQTVRPLVAARLVALGRLAPRRHRMTPAGAAAFATAQRMVHRVHHHTAVMRAEAQPPRPAGLAD